MNLRRRGGVNNNADGIRQTLRDNNLQGVFGPDFPTYNNIADDLIPTFTESIFNEDRLLTWLKTFLVFAVVKVGHELASLKTKDWFKEFEPKANTNQGGFTRLIPSFENPGINTPVYNMLVRLKEYLARHTRTLYVDRIKTVLTQPGSPQFVNQFETQIIYLNYDDPAQDICKSSTRAFFEALTGFYNMNKTNAMFVNQGAAQAQNVNPQVARLQQPAQPQRVPNIPANPNLPEAYVRNHRQSSNISEDLIRFAKLMTRGGRDSILKPIPEGLLPYQGRSDRNIKVTHALVSPDGYIAKLDISRFRESNVSLLSFGSIMNSYKTVQQRPLNMGTLRQNGWLMIARENVETNVLVNWIFNDETRFAYYNLYRLFFSKQSNKQTFPYELRSNGNIRKAFAFHMLHRIHYKRAKRNTTHSYAVMRKGALKARVIERLSDSLSDMITAFSHELRSIMETSPQVLVDEATYEPLDMIGSGGLGSVPMQLIMSLSALKMGKINMQENVFKYYISTHNPANNSWDFKPATNQDGFFATDLRQELQNVGANPINDYIGRIATNAQMSRAAKAGIYTWAGVRSHERIFIRSIYQVDGLYGDLIPRMKSTSGVVFPSEAITIDNNEHIILNDIMKNDMYPVIQRPRRPLRGGDTIEAASNKSAFNSYTMMKTFIKGHLAKENPGIQDVEVDVIAPEYPMANPFTVIEQPANSRLPPLIHETRADSIVCGSGEINGHTVFVYYMVEYKTLMETHINGPAERILHSGARRQVLHNAILCTLNTGVRINYALTVHGTRRYEDDGAYTAGYLGVCAVNYDGQYAKTLVEKLLTSPYVGAKTYYMDQNAFISSNPILRNGNLLEGMQIMNRVGTGNVGATGAFVVGGRVARGNNVSRIQNVDVAPRDALVSTFMMHMVREFRKIENMSVYFLYNFANFDAHIDAHNALFGAHAMDISFHRRRYPLRGMNPEHALTTKRKALNMVVEDRMKALIRLLNDLPPAVRDRIEKNISRHLSDWFDGLTSNYPVQLVQYDMQQQTPYQLLLRTLHRLLNIVLLQHAKGNEWKVKAIQAAAEDPEDEVDIVTFFNQHRGAPGVRQGDNFLHLSQRGLMSERALHVLWDSVDTVFYNAITIIVAMNR